MDLRAYYQTIRRIESEIEEVSAVIVSLDGSRTKTEVPRAVAARMIAEGKAELADAEDAAEFRAGVEARWKARRG